MARVLAWAGEYARQLIMYNPPKFKQATFSRHPGVSGFSKASSPLANATS